MKEPGEVLFRVGNRDIVMNGLYSHLGPGGFDRCMAVDYDPKTNRSKWLSPGVRGPMAVIHDCNRLVDRFKTTKPYIQFVGGRIWFDMDYVPTHEQSRILDNWDEELEKAGIGGNRVDPEIIAELEKK